MEVLILHVENKLKKIPSYSEELGLDLHKPGDRFLWFLASLLFAKRISAEIAKKTFLLFTDRGLTTLDKILDAGWDKLVDILDSGGYVRYDFSTATNILECMKLLKKKYRGNLDRLHEMALDSKDLERRLMEFKGFGPTAVNIFLRELRGIWSKANPPPSVIAVKVAECLSIKDVKKFESQLVRIYLEYCKKRRCNTCPVKAFCAKKT